MSGAFAEWNRTTAREGQALPLIIAASRLIGQTSRLLRKGFFAY
jgi:hypothetical protein